MIWGCFTYDFNGPCHIWYPETKPEKKKADKDVELMNIAIEQEARETWELNTAMRGMGLRNMPGRKPAWKFNADDVAFVREATGYWLVSLSDRRPGSKTIKTTAGIF